MCTQRKGKRQMCIRDRYEIVGVEPLELAKVEDDLDDDDDPFEEDEEEE